MAEEPPVTFFELLTDSLLPGIDLALSIEALNDFLRRHRPFIDQVHQHRPDLWDKMRDRTKARRQALPEK